MATLKVSPSDALPGDTLWIVVEDFPFTDADNPIQYAICVYNANDVIHTITGNWHSDSLYSDHYQSFVIPDDYVGELIFVLYTDDNTVEHARTSVMVYEPNYEAPTIGNFELVPIDSNGKTMEYAVQGVSRIKAIASGCIAGSGEIDQYVFNGRDMSRTSVVTSNSSAEATSSLLTAYGNLSYSVYVYNTNNEKTKRSVSIFCYPYESPYFKYFRSYRSNSLGNPDANGKYITCEYEVYHSLVNDSNSITVKIYCNGSLINTAYNSSKKITIDGTYNVGTTYELYATVVDTYGGNGTSSTETLYESGRILNISQSGDSIGIGGLASSESGRLDCYWDANFIGDVNINKTLTVESGLKVNNSNTTFEDGFKWTNTSTNATWTPPEVQTGSFDSDDLYIEAGIGTGTIDFDQKFKSEPFVSITPVAYSQYYDSNDTVITITSISDSSFSVRISGDKTYIQMPTYNWIAVAT